MVPNLRVGRQLTCEGEGPSAGERDKDGEEGGEQVVQGQRPRHPAHRAHAAHEGHRVFVGRHCVDTCGVQMQKLYIVVLTTFSSQRINLLNASQDAELRA